MNYSSPFCPDDDEVFTTNGKMKISKLYYKMNPKRDPFNRILDIQNIFLTRCVSNQSDIIDLKMKKEKNLKDIKDINDYYNILNKKNNNKINHKILNREEKPFYFSDYNRNFFPTSIKVNNTNYRNKNISCSESKFNSKTNNSNINSKGSSNICNNSSININQSISTFNKPKIINHSHSYVLKLDKTYYKSPTLNKKIYILTHNNKKINNSSRFSLSNNSSGFFDDSDMTKYNDYIPFAKQNYLNGQFEFDLSKKNELGQLKQYQMKETQNRNKVKPFIY